MRRMILGLCVAIMIVSGFVSVDASQKKIFCSLAIDTPSSYNVGTQVVVAKFSLTAVGDDALINGIVLRVDSTTPSMLSDIYLFDGITLLGVQEVHTLEPIKFNNMDWWTKESQKRALTVRMDLMGGFSGQLQVSLVKVKARMKVTGLPLGGLMLSPVGGGGGGGTISPIPNPIFGLYSGSPSGEVRSTDGVNVHVLTFTIKAIGDRDLFISSLKFKKRGGVCIKNIRVFHGLNLRGEGSLGWVPVHIILKGGETAALTVEVASSSGKLRLNLVGADTHISLGDGTFKPIEAKGLPVLGNRMRVIMPSSKAPSTRGAKRFTWGAIKSS